MKDNYLDKKPMRAEKIPFTTDDAGIVTLEIENKGFMNQLAQKLFQKPKISYVHLDKLGSFIWQNLDGKKDVSELAENVESQFGEEAHPLYERLIKYLEILASYHFIEWNEK